MSSKKLAAILSPAQWVNWLETILFDWSSCGMKCYRFMLLWSSAARQFNSQGFVDVNQFMVNSSVQCWQPKWVNLSQRGPCYIYQIKRPMSRNIAMSKTTVPLHRCLWKVKNKQTCFNIRNTTVVLGHTNIRHIECPRCLPIGYFWSVCLKTSDNSSL